MILRRNDNCHNLKIDKIFRFATDSVFRQNPQPEYTPNPPPEVGVLLLTDGTDFLLTTGETLSLA